MTAVILPRRVNVAAAQLAAEQAEISAAIALAAANASGPTVIYATKALADAGLAGLAANAVVEVSIDESRAGRRSRYRKTGGVYVFELDLSSTRVIFVSNAGNDANAGLSPSTPKATLASAFAAAVAGDVVRLARGGVFRETSSAPVGVIVEAYGNGLAPIITASDLVTSFTLEGAGPAYRFSVTLPAGTASRCYPGMFRNGVRPREYRIGRDGLTDNAGVIAAVQANPNSFGFLGWATNPSGDVSGSWTAGSKDYVYHAPASANPNSDGGVYEVYAREYATGSNGLYRGIRIQSGFHHDGSSAAMDGGSIERLARHGYLPSIPQYRDVTVIGDNPAYAGGGFMHSNPNSLQPDALYERVTVVGQSLLGPNGTGFYQHGQITGEHRRKITRLRDCAAYGMGLCVGLGEVELVEVDGFRARNFNSLVGAALNSTVKMRKVDAKGGYGGTGAGARLLSSTSPGSLIINDSLIDFRSQALFYTSGGFGPVEVYDTDLILRSAENPGSAPYIAWANNTSLARFWLERCRLIAPARAAGLIRANAATDVRVRDCLLVGVSSTSLINGVSTSLLSLDAASRAISISREKAIERDDEDGLALRYGVYKPGDWIFSGIAHPGSSRQPRRYVAVGDRIIGTTVGVSSMTSWAVIATPASFLNAVCFNEGGSGTCFIAVGNNGLIMRSDANGENWAAVGAGVTTQHLRAVWAMDAANTVVAVGDNGTVLRSTDGGQTWALAATPGTTRSLFGVASNRAGTLWVACGAEGRVITSTDGNAWVEQTQGSATWRAAYRVNDATFLIGGDDGGLRTSADGASWATITTNTINSIRGFGWNGGGNVVAIARQTGNFTDTFLNSSDSGATWSIDEQTVPMELTAITGGLNPMESFGAGNNTIFSNMYFVAVGESQAWCMRMLKTWSIQRFFDESTQDTSETFDRWISRAV